MDAPALVRLFRELGDPGPDWEPREHAWTTSTACHGVVALVDPAAVLDVAAGLDVDRCVATLAVSAVDRTVTAALRVVAPDLDHVQAALATLVEQGLAEPLGGLQEEGVERIAALLAYRLLGVGCVLRVATADPARGQLGVLDATTVSAVTPVLAEPERALLLGT